MTSREDMTLSDRVQAEVDKHGGWKNTLDYIARLEAALRSVQPVSEAVVTDAMVEAYCDAVHAYLGNLSNQQWDADRKDHAFTVRRVARIGLTAALQDRAP